MPVTRMNCPNCRQPIQAEVDQLFDVNVDPSAKQKLLSGAANFISCPNCGYQGNLSTPVVYHDPEKELLLTFVPPEIGLPRNEQERVIGNLINQVVNNLPQEKRKGYLLRPQSTLTMQGLVERILEEDGITKEMIQAQQQRLALLQRMISVKDPDVLAEIAKQEDKLVDSDFFSLLNRLIETALMGGDRQSAHELSDLQNKLLPLTTFGRQIQQQSKEVETAIAELQKEGQNLTQEKLLELVLKAPNETRRRAYVSLVRQGMDYQFFQMLSERVDKAKGDEQARLVNIREQLLTWTQEIDQQIEERHKMTVGVLEQILQSPDVMQTMQQNLSIVDEYFVEVVNHAMEQARSQGDLDRIGKLQKVVQVIEEASAASPEMALIEELLEAPDDAARQQILVDHPEMVTQELIDSLTGILSQVEQSDDQALKDQVKAVHRQVLRFSMQKNLGG